jgi:hypothetical protein
MLNVSGISIISFGILINRHCEVAFSAAEAIST